MRLVLDTNVVVSAMLWGGRPRLLLDATRARRSGGRPAPWDLTARASRSLPLAPCAVCPAPLLACLPCLAGLGT